MFAISWWFTLVGYSSTSSIKSNLSHTDDIAMRWCWHTETHQRASRTLIATRFADSSLYVYAQFRCHQLAKEKREISLPASGVQSGKAPKEQLMINNDHHRCCLLSTRPRAYRRHRSRMCDSCCALRRTFHFNHRYGYWVGTEVLDSLAREHVVNQILRLTRWCQSVLHAMIGEQHSVEWVDA